MSQKRRNFRLTFAVAIVLLLAAAFLLTGVLGALPGARVDMTQDRLYTLSDAAVEILGSLEVPVQVKLYITPEDKMPTELRTLQRDVTDKLRDYERASNGMLQYSVHNPQTDEQLQNDLAAKGIRPFQVQSVERDEIGVKLIWSAMTIAYKDYPEEVIPQILPQSLGNLEYEVVSRVYRLVQEEQPVVALVAPTRPVNPQLAMMYLQQGMQPPQPQDVYQTLGQLFEQEHYRVVRSDLTRESPIPDDASVLVVVGPRDLNERQAFEINRAVSNGLPAVIAVQAHDYDYQAARSGGFTVQARGIDSGLDEVLETWGLRVVKDNFCDNSLAVLSVPRTQTVGGLRFQTSEPVRLPIQIMVPEPQMNQDSPLTNRIGNVLYLWGTPVEWNDSDMARLGLTTTVLMTSSGECWTEPFSDGPVPPTYFDAVASDFLGPQPLGVLVEGTLPDAFQGRSVPEWPAPAGADTTAAAPPPDTVAPLDPQPTQVVLLGCAKMFEDDLLQAGQQAMLMLNAVDALVHGPALISIRSKMLTQRTIRQVGDTQKLLWRLFVVALVPVLLVIYGFVRIGVRRREAAHYRAAQRT